MAVYRLIIPPHVAKIARYLPPDLKRSVKQALRSVSADPFADVPLIGELTGLWRIRIRRFRIIYEPDRKALVIRIFALGRRREVYEAVAEQLRYERERK